MRETREPSACRLHSQLDLASSVAVARVMTRNIECRVTNVRPIEVTDYNGYPPQHGRGADCRSNGVILCLIPPRLTRRVLPHFEATCLAEIPVTWANPPDRNSVLWLHASSTVVRNLSPSIERNPFSPCAERVHP